MRGLCISFTSSYFLFPVGGGRKSLRDRGGGGGLKNFRTEGGYRFGGGELLLLGGGGQYPITCHGIDRDQWHEMG